MTTAVGYTSITAFSSLYAREIGLDSSGLLYFVFAVSIIAVRLLVIGGMSDRRGHTAVALPGVADRGRRPGDHGAVPASRARMSSVWPRSAPASRSCSPR